MFVVRLYIILTTYIIKIDKGETVHHCDPFEDADSAIRVIPTIVVECIT